MTETSTYFEIILRFASIPVHIMAIASIIIIIFIIVMIIIKTIMNMIMIMIMTMIIVTFIDIIITLMKFQGYPKNYVVHVYQILH